MPMNSSASNCLGLPSFDARRSASAGALQSLSSSLSCCLAEARGACRVHTYAALLLLSVLLCPQRSGCIGCIEPVTHHAGVEVHTRSSIG